MSIWFVRVLCILSVASLGCATVRQAETAGTIVPGDLVAIDYTCWMTNGDMATTCDDRLASEPKVPKAEIFLPRKSYGPVVIPAGGIPGLKPAYLKSFEQAVIGYLSEEVVGFRVGKTRTVTLNGDISEGIPDEQRFLKMSRTRIRNKEYRTTPEAYASWNKMPPEVGQEVLIDRTLGLPGKVVSVSPSEVIIEVHAEPDTLVETPFGEGIIQERETYYEIEINPQLGTLLRTGPLVARIVDMDEKSFTLDYGHPFGGEKLQCDVTVESVNLSDTGETAGLSGDDLLEPKDSTDEQ